MATHWQEAESKYLWGLLQLQLACGSHPHPTWRALTGVWVTPAGLAQPPSSWGQGGASGVGLGEALARGSPVWGPAQGVCACRTGPLRHGAGGTVDDAPTVQAPCWGLLCCAGPCAGSPGPAGLPPCGVDVLLARGGSPSDLWSRLRTWLRVVEARRVQALPGPILGSHPAGRPGPTLASLGGGSPWGEAGMARPGGAHLPHDCHSVPRFPCLEGQEGSLAACLPSPDHRWVSRPGG